MSGICQKHPSALNDGDCMDCLRGELSRLREENECLRDGRLRDPLLDATLRPLNEELSRLRDAARVFMRGCGNQGCRVQRPSGQATTGVCECLTKYSHSLAALREALGKGG